MDQAFRILTVLAALFIAQVSALAEPSNCRLAPDVIAAADFLLAEAKDTGRFWRDRMGDDAAYLRIRYAGLSRKAGLRLADTLKQRAKPPQRIDELRLALMPPAERRAAMAAAGPAGAAPSGGISALRAAIIDGDADWLFAEMARLAALPGANADQQIAVQTDLARALADLDDAAKLRIAGQAEAKGLWLLARAILSTAADLRPWLATLRRSPHNPPTAQGLERLFAPLWRGYGRMGAAPPSREALPDELRRLADGIDARLSPDSADYDAVLALMNVVPRTQLLVTAVNQTGEARLGRDIAAPLLARIQSGQIDPHADDDRIRALILAGTASIMGPERMRLTYGSFNAAGEGTSSETALAALERSLVRHTLGAFARGEEAAPARPALLSPGFDWAGWREAAQAVRDGRAAAPENRGAEAELLHAIGRHADAVRVLREVGATDDMRRRGHAMMVMLDQMCGGELWPHPVIGIPVYRFPAR